MAVALTPGGDYLGAGYADGTLALYSLASGPARPLIATRQQSITALAVSPDGRWLWSGGLDGSIRSFSIGSGAPSCASAATRPQHQDAVTSLSMSPRGDYLASGSRDQKILLFTWDRSTGCLTQHGHPLQEHRAAVTALAFSREGDLLASGDEAAAVVLWDVHSEKVLGLPLRGHLRPITGLAFARDGLLWSSDAQTVWQWPTSEAQWLTQACLRAGRNLSLTEWQRGLGDTPYCRICKSHPPGAQALPSTQLCTP
jgi:WD40 repeat protein